MTERLRIFGERPPSKKKRAQIFHEIFTGTSRSNQKTRDENHKNHGIGRGRHHRVPRSPLTPLL